MEERDFDSLIEDAKRARRRDDPKSAIEELSKTLEKLLIALKEQAQAQRRAQRDRGASTP